MAIAKAIKKTIQVTLTLNHDEAMTLQLIFAKIGGNPSKGMRMHMDAMLYALRDAGVDYPPNYDEYFTSKNGLFFTDKELPK